MMPFQSVVLDKASLLRAIQADCATFFAFYLQEDLTLEVPDLHDEIWQELLEILEKANQPEFVVGHLQKLFAVPRGHAKTTLIKLAVILFLRYSQFSFAMYVSKTQAMAKAAVRDITLFLKSEQESELYGKCVVLKENETEAVWIYKIHVPGRNSMKTIILRALGSNQQVRGSNVLNRRPDILVMDDIEDLDTAATEESQDKLDEWALGSLLKATAPRSIRIIIGNMIKSTTLLARLAKDPAWNPTVFGCLVRDKVTRELRSLWPEMWSVEYHLSDYKTHRRLGKGHIWEAEMMNLSGDKLLAMSLDDAIMTPFISPDDVQCGFFCVDPAYGEDSWHDKSSISVHVQLKNAQAVDVPVLAEIRSGRWTEVQVFDQLLELSYYWGIRTWAIESNTAQKLWTPLLRLLAKDRMLSPDFMLILPLVLSNEKGAKASRIIAFRNLVAGKSYALSDSVIDFKLTLEEYSPESTKHDDSVDSAAMGAIVWDSYGDVVKTNLRQDIAGMLMASGNNVGNAGEIDVCRF